MDCPQLFEFMFHGQVGIHHHRCKRRGAAECKRRGARVCRSDNLDWTDLARMEPGYLQGRDQHHSAGECIRRMLWWSVELQPQQKQPALTANKAAPTTPQLG